MKNKPHFKLTLFGGFRLLATDLKPLNPGARKSKALLAWLAVNPDHQHPREKLAALLWPDSEETAARHSLRQALADLRKVIPANTGLLNASKDFISLNSDLIEIDAQAFLKALSKGDADSLDQAIGLYSGEFLEGCNPHSDLFDEWCDAYRTEYSERIASAIDLRLSQHLLQKNYELAVNLAIRLIAIDPVRESAYRALMLAHTRLGNHATALRWYRRCQYTLQHELDVNPDPETEALYHQELFTEGDKTKQQMIDTSSLELGSNTVSTDNQRVLYQVNSAIEGILDQIGGQSFLIRGDAGVGISELATEIITQAKAQDFFCCRKKLSAKEKHSNTEILMELTHSFSDCLLNYPNAPDANEARTYEIKAHSKLSKVNHDIAKLVKTTASFQPVLLLVEHIHQANMDTLNLLAELISSAGSSSMLLLMTSRFEGEPLDPVWRGAMRGAPLTTIDMS